MEHEDYTSEYLREPGVEIGAFTSPIPGIRPTYVDHFAKYAGEPTNAQYYGSACDLPYRDSSLSYVATSHVIEHVANPIAALKEWYRVLKHNGIVYMVVPDRRKTFDRPRGLTPIEHVFDDFAAAKTQSDGTHIDDFVYGIDWNEFSPSTLPGAEEAEKAALAQSYRNAIRQGHEINIHFHTFELESLEKMIRQANTRKLWPGNMEIIDSCQDFPLSTPNGFLIVARVRKPIRTRFLAAFSRQGLRPDARPPTFS